VYKAAVRTLIRRNISRLNDGDYASTLVMFRPDATLTFPGDNSWSRQYRDPQLGMTASPTHRGRDEIEGFLRRYVGHGVQMHVEEILVNGPPWNTRAAARVHHRIVDESGAEIYSNRAVLFVHTRWGKIVEQEDYEDTGRVMAFDARSADEAVSRPEA
jgi:ketosteroid isomerase-like protein